MTNIRYYYDPSSSFKFKAYDSADKVWGDSKGTFIASTMTLWGCKLEVRRYLKRVSKTDKANVKVQRANQSSDSYEKREWNLQRNVNIMRASLLVALFITFGTFLWSAWTSGALAVNLRSTGAIFIFASFGAAMCWAFAVEALERLRHESDKR